MYPNKERLILFDADGTTIDAFSAIDMAFSRHNMNIGDLERFQKRRNLFKYLGGLKEFPFNLKKQIGNHSRKQLLSTLTEVYRHEAQLFPGMAELIQTLIAAPDIRVGLVTRNITYEPEITLRQLFLRHGIDTKDLDYMVRVPLGQEKALHFRLAREQFKINPARAYACGDEHKDYLAAITTGIHPFIVSYGFEDHRRLTRKFDIPEELVSRSPSDLCACVLHALDIDQPAAS
ncbi:MAG: HAD hydrolase-like protein [Sulfuricellaceae bacterium]|nr:HAD hydrolase-like protein [Sulfuricellaceae bacterium]